MSSKLISFRLRAYKLTPARRRTSAAMVNSISSDPLTINTRADFIVELFPPKYLKFDCKWVQVQSRQRLEGTDLIAARFAVKVGKNRDLPIFDDKVFAIN